MSPVFGIAYVLHFVRPSIMRRKNFSSRFLGLLGWLIISSPAWLYLTHLSDFGALQGNDYYGIVQLITDGETVTGDPGRWLSLKSNEHRAGLPILFYVLNMALTDGHNLGLSVFSLLLLALVLVLLIGMLPDDLRSDLPTRVVFGFALALFCFTPVAAHNVAMGFSGTIWFFSNVLSVAAIGILVRRGERQELWALWPVLLLGLSGAFSHSTHLMLWPALLAGGVFLGLSLRRLLVLAAGATVVAALFVSSYQVLSYHPEPVTRNLSALLRYTATYLGLLFSSEVEPAQAMGWVGIAGWLASLGLAAMWWRPSPSLRRDVAPWLMLQLYGLGNAVLTAISRSGFGESQALSSRYASLSALFWIGLLTPFGIVAWRWRSAAPAGRRFAVPMALAVLVFGLTMAMYQRGGRMIDGFAARGSRHGVATLALVHGIHDNDLLARDGDASSRTDLAGPRFSTGCRTRAFRSTTKSRSRANRKGTM